MNIIEAEQALAEGKGVRRRAWINTGVLAWQKLFVKVPAPELTSALAAVKDGLAGALKLVHDNVEPNAEAIGGAIGGAIGTAAAAEGAGAIGPVASKIATLGATATGSVAGKLAEALHAIHVTGFHPALHWGLLNTDGVIGPADWQWEPNAEDREADDWEII